MKNLFNNIMSGNAASGGFADRLQGMFGQGGTSGAQNAENNSGNLFGGLLGAGAVGGLIGALMSNDSMKKMAGGALTGAGTAAVGMLAWNCFKKWSDSRNKPAGDASAHAAGSRPQPAGQIPLPEQQEQTVRLADAQAGFLLLEAMVFAARADGHIDEREQARICQTVEQLYPGQDVTVLVNSLMTRPIDPSEIASRVANQEEGMDVYRISCLMIDIDRVMERAYLDSLAESLGISAAVRKNIELEAENTKKMIFSEAAGGS